ATGGTDNKADDSNLEADEPGMEKLKQFFQQVLHIGGAAQEEVAHVLEEPTLEGVARYISSGKCKSIITMVGAGISTSAGIPDFRSPGSGLYDNLQAYDLPHPAAIFEIRYFMENPKPFFVLAKELYPGSFKPTPCHYFIRMLCEKGLLLRHYTQNIDTLERVSGLPNEKLVEAHGTFHTSHCLECRTEYSLSWMKEKIFADEIPTCTKEGCTGIVKPDIVFFGEGLPQRFSECAMQDFSKCDLLIIMGTSLAVQPFASLANRVSASTPRLYINLEKGGTVEDPIMALLTGGGMGGFTFDSEDNFRDVFKQATCDDGCYELAELLGWGEELRDLVKAEHERIDQEKPSEGQAGTSSEGEAGKSAAAASAEKEAGTKAPDQKL
ncbi:hypothetical protein BaRGS_00004534, partial [Batillaria attramentaria]